MGQRDWRTCPRRFGASCSQARAYQSNCGIWVKALSLTAVLWRLVMCIKEAKTVDLIVVAPYMTPEKEDGDVMEG